MKQCNDCGRHEGKHEVIKMPENVIQYKCDDCYQDMLEIIDFEESPPS
jgi:uncharacterized Zn finger protein